MSPIRECFWFSENRQTNKTNDNNTFFQLTFAHQIFPALILLFENNRLREFFFISIFSHDLTIHKNICMKTNLCFPFLPKTKKNHSQTFLISFLYHNKIIINIAQYAIHWLTIHLPMVYTFCNHPYLLKEWAL